MNTNETAITLYRLNACALCIDETDPEKITSVESLLFDLSTLRIATCNFSDENKLGEGGFGAVYKVLYKSITLQCHMHYTFSCDHDLIFLCRDCCLMDEKSQSRSF